MKQKADLPERATLTIPEAAAVLGVSSRTLYEQTARGDLASIRIGTRRVIPRIVIDNLIMSARLAHVSAATRAAVMQRDANCCRYCQRGGSSLSDPDGRPWHIDHVRPRARGGPSDEENLVLACERCNTSKHESCDPIWLERLRASETTAKANRKMGGLLAGGVFS